MTFTSGRTALFALAALAMAAPPARAQIDGLEIIAPANPGSGFDQTSRAVQEALQQGGLAKGVQVVNIPGAGGTIGLAQLVTAKKPGASLLTIGVTTVGAILTNKPPITLDDAHPLALLLREYSLVVVPANSDVKTRGRSRSQGEGGSGDRSVGRRLGRRCRPRHCGTIHEGGRRRPPQAQRDPLSRRRRADRRDHGRRRHRGRRRRARAGVANQVRQDPGLGGVLARAPSRSRRPDPQGARRRRRHRHVARADGSQAGHGCREEGAGRRHREDGGDASLEEHARTLRLARRLSGLRTNSVRS